MIDVIKEKVAQFSVRKEKDLIEDSKENYTIIKDYISGKDNIEISISAYDDSITEKMKSYGLFSSGKGEYAVIYLNLDGNLYLSPERAKVSVPITIVYEYKSDMYGMERLKLEDLARSYIQKLENELRDIKGYKIKLHPLKLVAKKL